MLNLNLFTQRQAGMDTTSSLRIAFKAYGDYHEKLQLYTRKRKKYGWEPRLIYGYIYTIISILHRTPLKK